MSKITFPDRPFTHDDARRLRISARQLRDGIATGRLRRVLRGVFVPAEIPDTIEIRARAAALVISPYSVVCDRSAAWLHGVDVFGSADREVLPPLETCVLRGRAASERAGVDGRSRDLLPVDLTTVQGVSVTTPLRTAMDLGCALPRHRALGALDQFMRVCGVTSEEMGQLLPRYWRRRGVVQLRELVPLARSGAESLRESWIRLDIFDAGLPEPESQYWIEVDGVPTYRLDLAYPRHRVAVEYDGEEFHRTAEQRERDHRRRSWLRAHGWTVIVVTKENLQEGLWLTELRDALRPRTQRLRWARIPA